MSGDEPRRSGRANKGQHKHPSNSPAPEVKPTKEKAKKGKKSAASQSSEPEDGEGNEEEEQVEEEEEGEEGGEDGEEEEEEEEVAEVIRCICGNENAKDKRAFIGCDKCSVWQHNVCMGMPDDEDEVGEHYFCEQCKPEEHGETLEALARGEKIWETRNKLYSAEKKKSKGRKSKGGNEDKPAWLKRELKEDNVNAEQPQESKEEASDTKVAATKESGTKRKRSIKEEVEEPESKSAAEKPTRAVRQDKRRKAEAKSSPDPETAIVPIEKLPLDRQKIAQALSKILASDFQNRVKSSELKLTGDETPESLAEHHASHIEYALHMNHGGTGTSAYGTQFRALNANLKKNRTLLEELLAGRLTADELSTMSSSDMASEELQKERAAMKAEADRQMTIEQVDQGPRYRRTHKGDEIVEGEAAATSSAPVVRPVRQQTATDVEMAGLSAGSPTAASPTVGADHPQSAKSDEDRRTSGAAFDMQDIWAKTGQSGTTNRPLQMPARRRSSIQPQQGGGIKEDADVDRLLAADDDDEEAYSPQEYPGDIVWRGKVISTTNDAAPVVNARWVAGRDVSQTMPWRELLPNSLNIDGRLQIPKAEEYLCGLQWSSSSDVSVLALTPYDNAETFDSVFEYFKTRERYAVVNKDKPAALLVKDLYIIPVDIGDKLPDHIEMLEHCTIKKPLDERLLLATFVVARTSTEHSQQGGVASTVAAAGQATNGHRDRVLSSQGPAASPINASGPTFSGSAHSPLQHGYSTAQAAGHNAFNVAAASPAAYSVHQQQLSQDEIMRMGFEILGPLFHSPVAQQVLAAPGVTKDVVMNMKKIFDEDVAAQTDFTAFAANLGYGGGGTQ